MKEISSRVDGRWNVWDEIPTFDGIRWQVIATFDFEDEAEEYIRKTGQIGDLKSPETPKKEPHNKDIR